MSATRTTLAAGICLMMFSGISAGAEQSAITFAGGSGTGEDPYQIGTAKQLVEMGRTPALLDKSYVLLNDIDMDPNLPGGQVFSGSLIAPGVTVLGFGTPFFQGTAFSGTLNGRGHAIRNFTCHSVLEAEVAAGMTVEDADFKARILLVEDNPTNQIVAKSLLSKLGCQVDVASDGCEGVESATRFPYDLVFMDCQMPRKDGFEATRDIRKTYSSDQLPIVAMTANAMKGDRERCLDAGMNDYVSKPISKEKVLAVLHKWLGKTVTVASQEVEVPVAVGEVAMKLEMAGTEGKMFGIVELYAEMEPLFEALVSLLSQPDWMERLKGSSKDPRSEVPPEADAGDGLDRADGLERPYHHPGGMKDEYADRTKRGGIHSIRVLLIDDDLTHCQLMQLFLRDGSSVVEFSVQTAQSLASGRECLDREGFDLVLLDLGLPDSQGLATVEGICKPYPDIPVVVLTGLACEEAGVEAVRLGASDYFVKGKISRESLTRSIRYALERKQIEQRLKASNHALLETTVRANTLAEQARLASAAKSEFLARVSHELLTPMNAILGFSNILAEEALSDGHRAHVTLIRESAGILLTLISDILDFTKIEAGQIDVEMVDCSLGKLLDSLHATIHGDLVITFYV